MPDSKEAAETLRLGLLSGYVQISDVRNWASSIVDTDLAPGQPIIELAAPGDRDRFGVAELLAQIPGHPDPIRVRRRVLGHALQALDHDPSRGADIARWLHDQARNGELPEDVFGPEPLILADDFDLAQRGIFGTTRDAVAILRDYLVQHSLDPAS